MRKTNTTTNTTTTVTSTNNTKLRGISSCRTNTITF